MASCAININGKKHNAASAVFDYVDSTSERTALDVMNALAEAVDITISDSAGTTVGIGDSAKIGDQLEVINSAAVNLYNAPGKLFNVEDYRSEQVLLESHINSDVLNALKYIPKEEAISDEEFVYERTVTENEDESIPKSKKKKRKERAKRISKVFGVKERDITLVEEMLVNLEKEIRRLSRQEQTEATRSDILILENLKRQLSNAESTVELADAYASFVSFVENTATFAKQRMAKIRNDYAKDYNSMNQEERLKMLQDIYELKQSIDAFYSHESEETSLLNIMQVYIGELGDDIDDEVRIILSEAIHDMSIVNKRFLDIGIPIQADYLMQFVPDEKINSQLRNRIDDIKQNGRINGLRRKDPRYLALYTQHVPLSASFRQAVLDLNVLQLEEQIVGRDSIIKELREAHRDPGFITTYMDPLIYSSEVSMQAFAIAVKNKLYEAHETTIDTKYQIKDAYYKYRDWAGGNEDNVAELNKHLYETAVIYVYDSATDSYVSKQVLSFVQEYDISRFNVEMNTAFEAIKEQFEYPKNATSEELTDYFENNPLADDYRDAIADWYEANTIPIDGAVNEIVNLKREIKALVKQKVKLMYKDELSNNQRLKLDRINQELAGLNNELKKISRDGVPIGRLTKPNDSYINPKYTNMPAEAKEYYDILMGIYKKDQLKLGRNALPKNSWESFSYVLPSIRKSAYDSLLENGLKASASNMFSDTFLFQETDTDFGMTLDANGEKLKSIPQYYTNLVDADLVSKDITSSIIKFHDMSNRFKAKSEISGVVNIMRTAVMNRTRVELNSEGQPVLDSVAKKLGINKIANLNSDRQDSNALKQLESFIDNVYYGITDKESTKKALLQSLSRTKLSSAMATLTAVNTLAGSYMQSTNQLIMDSVQGAQEAWAGQFYNNKDLWWAKEKLYNIFNGNLIAGGAEKARQKFTYNNKLNQFLESVDAFQSFGRDVGGETGSMFKKSWNMDTLFLFQHSAEYMTTAERALALAHSYEGKLKDNAGNVITNDKGEPADVWDVLIKDEKGKLIVDPKVANFKLADFQVLLHGLLKKTNQLKGDFDTPLANRYAIGKLLVLFRSYFMPGWRKRFGHSAGGTHIDVEMGQISEGYYQTLANNFSNALYAFRNLEFAEGTKRLFGVGEDELSKANRARLLHELITIQVAMLSVTAMGLLFDDDDDEDKFLVNMVTYQMLRLRTELTSFRSPTEFFRIAQSPTAAATPIKHWAQFIKSTWDLGAYSVGLPVDEENVFYQRKSGAYQKGDLKWWKEFYDVQPIIAAFLKSGSPEDALKFYE